MVMPFVAQDLGHIMKTKRLSERIITYLFYQLLRGLKASTYDSMILIYSNSCLSEAHGVTAVIKTLTFTNHIF